jgi:hypothetical protein
MGKKNGDGHIEDPPIPAALRDGYLTSHCISPKLLRADDFESFMKDRRKALLSLISSATGHSIADAANVAEEGEEVSEDVARDSGISVTGA